MDLVPLIFHERQERDSMMCGQHALNNLLQGAYFSPTDLAAIASQLDDEEDATLDGPHRNRDSVNMDDSGFFSLSTLDRCAQVWGLSLGTRWRSEEMRPYHDKPEEQEAFILNLASHWFTIRRFGSKQNRFYNLNSFFPNPQWVSATYLSMVLSQAEEEGYSVFVVRPLDPSANKSTNTSDLSSSPAQAASFLPPCSADERASRLGSPSNTPLIAPVGAWGREAQSASFGEFDDDADLQAALAASMADEPSQTDQSNTSPADHSSTQATPSPNDESDPVAASLRRAQARLQAFQREQTEALMGGGGYDGYGYGQGASYGGAGAAAGVGSSGEAGETRNLSASRGGASSAAGRGQESPPRSRRRQADPSPTVPNPANRHNIPSSFSSSIDARDPNPVPLPRSSSSRNSRATSSNPTLPAAPAPSVDSHPAPSSRSKRTRHDEDEEMLRKAIAASVREQEKRDRQAARSAGDRNAMDEDSDVELDDDEGDAEFDEDYDDIFNNPTPPSDQRPTTSRTPPYASHTPSPPYPAGVAGDRDYNDEDEELQRALAASLESIPQGWEGIKVDSPVRAPSTAAPSLPRADASVRSVASAAGIPPPGGAVVEAVGASVQRGQEQDEEMGGESDSVGGDETGTTEVEQAESLSPGEIRRRRLARFG